METCEHDEGRGCMDPDAHFHYAMIKCACGFDPGDHLSDDAACVELMRHIHSHAIVDNVCPECGKGFVKLAHSKGRPAVYCSRTCQVSALHKRNGVKS